MPPHRKPRRFLTTTSSFYDSAGAIADYVGSPLPSPTTTSGFNYPWNARRLSVDNSKGGESDGEDEYTLTGYGELSTEDAFMLPPSPTQTIKYRYRAYRPKLARLRGKYRSSLSASKGPLLKTTGKSGASRPSDYAAILQTYLSGTPGRSPKRDFQALVQKYCDSADSRRDRDDDGYVTPRKGYARRDAVSSSAGQAFAAR
ncbi:hypothetical protein BV20DRAFT_1055377 [Pilatotrama ljubarskyi]|nr:hypothetical protein BV20DRAFT_1055377 [Pilatotrama ljubarskyi]